MRADIEEWLGQVNEDPLEPERPLIDAHHHLWDHPKHCYLTDEFRNDALAHNVRQSVFVECLSGYRVDGPETLRPVGETAYIDSLASAVPTDGLRKDDKLVASAIISFADLQLGTAVDAVLSAHRSASPDRFRGIRHSGAWDASDAVRQSHSGCPPGMFLRDDFHEGFGCLQQHGLLFEAWCYHPQLQELASLARAFPATAIVMDHVGGPLGVGPYAGHREDVFAVWQEGIRALAACPNVVMKLGGLAMPVNGFDWHRRATPPGSRELETALAPYFHFCIAQFGIDRCLFESNFPVDKVSCSYTVLWNAFKRLAAQYSQADQDALLHDNALRVYQLPPH